MKEANPPNLNPFGEALWGTMVARGINSWAELAELLQEAGSDITEEQIRAWTHNPPPDVIHTLIEEED